MSVRVYVDGLSVGFVREMTESQIQEFPTEETAQAAVDALTAIAEEDIPELPKMIRMRQKLTELGGE